MECEKYKILPNAILTTYYSQLFDIVIENFIIDKFIKTIGPGGTVISCKIDKMLELPNGFMEVIDYKSGANSNSQFLRQRPLGVSAENCKFLTYYLEL